MSSKRNNFISVYFLAAFVFVLIILTTIISPVQAADLQSRSIRLGSSFVSENTTHNYTFTTVTPGNVGSIQFEYCENSPLFNQPCIPPAGLNVTSASIATQTGLSGFSLSGATNATRLVITRAPVAEAGTTASFSFGNIINPSTPDSVQYVRITVFDNQNATGSAIDTGAVAFVIEDRFNVDAYVPPYLTFCTAVTVALDCSSVTGFLADFGELNEFAPATATTQMSASTNDPTGYNIFISGATMTSGANIIPALATQTASIQGVSQFGINLRANTNPSLGVNPESGPVGSGSPSPNYNTPNLFRFVPGDLLASAPLSSGFNRYTISYVVNVNEDQAPGVYATTLTYTAVASF